MTREIPEELVVDFDIYDPSLAAPVDVIQERVAEMAAKGPLVYSPAYGGHWIVTRYKEIHEILNDSETFSSYPNNLVTPADFGKFIPLELDPPDSIPYRKVMLPLFSPHRIKVLSDSVRTVVSDLIDQFAAKGEAEFISEFAHELPSRTFLALMGWPLGDAELFSDATDVILFGKPGGTQEESDQARIAAGLKVAAYFHEVIEDRRARPNGDPTSNLINSQVEFPDGARLLEEQELILMFYLLMMGGLHTVQSTLAWAIVYLINNPAQRDEIIADPSVIPQAVEELLRIEAAVIPGRRATRDVEFGGVQIAKDEQLILMLCGANRDPAEFPEPEKLSIKRFPNRHLSFGAGAHRCLGSHLARIELKIALEELHRRIPDYQLIESDPPVFHSTQVRGCKQMHITFTPES
jgi:cytochrome P450